MLIKPTDCAMEGGVEIRMAWALDDAELTEPELDCPVPGPAARGVTVT